MNYITPIANFTEIFSQNQSGKSQSTQTNCNGQSFSSKYLDVSKLANMQIAGQNNAAYLSLSRQKEESVDDLFSFSNTEDEQAEEYIDKINKLLQDFHK